MSDRYFIRVGEQNRLFSLIGATLKKKTECYVCGGTAMMFLGFKETTKDIDIIFNKEEDYENFRKTLLQLGAKESEIKIQNPKKIASMLSLGDARFDLFLNYLIHFKLNSSIISRIKESHEFSNLIIKVISPEDIILFKSMADREGDRVDVANIIKIININWDSILKEAQEQTKGSEYFFCAFLYNFLIGIKEDFKSDIPNDFLKELEKLTKEALIEAEKRLKR